MRAVLPVALVIVSLLAVAPVAYAKGPTAAVIKGPGLASPVRIESYEATMVLPGLGELMRLTGGEVLFGGGVPLRPDRPDGDLGPRYAVTYLMDRRVVLAQELYPFAPTGPATFTPPGAARRAAAGGRGSARA